MTDNGTSLNDPELVAIRQSWEQRLSGSQLVGKAAHLQGTACCGTADMYADPARRVREALDELARKADLLRDTNVFRPLCVNSGLHGVHFVDKIFGAEVYELDGERGNWQVNYLSTPVGELARPDLEASVTWRAVRAFAEAFVASGVTVPVLALPTIASVLNVGLNLYGQELLLAMVVDPDAARHDLAIVNSVLLELHRWYIRNVPTELLHQVVAALRYQPPGCGQICGCSTQLLSRKQYREFIAPHDDAVLSLYPNGGMIHLCGSHTQHIPTWRDMRSLRAVQVNDRAAEDLETYLSEMPEKIYYVNPCEGMPLARVGELARRSSIVVVSEPGDTPRKGKPFSS